MIIGVCLSDPAKVGSKHAGAHMRWPWAQTASHCGRRGRLKSPVGRTERRKWETEIKEAGEDLLIRQTDEEQPRVVLSWRLTLLTTRYKRGDRGH